MILSFLHTLDIENGVFKIGVLAPCAVLLQGEAAILGLLQPFDFVPALADAPDRVLAGIENLLVDFLRNRDLVSMDT